LTRRGRRHIIVLTTPKRHVEVATRIEQHSLLVTLVELLDRLPIPPPSNKRGPGRPRVYTDRLFLKALLIMILRHLHTVTEFLSVLAQPTPEMRRLRVLLTERGKFPSRRTFERRIKALPETLPAQIGCLGRRYLVALIRPWASSGRAVALDSTVLRARGGVWHKKDREAGKVPHTSIDTEAHWTKSGWHGGRCTVGSCTWQPPWQGYGYHWPPG
jgi:hypothetical protein